MNRLIAVANRILKNSACRIATGETVAVDTFVDFFERSPDEFRRLVNRNDLWKILSLIAERRAIDEIRRETREKRGGKQSVMNEDSRGMSIFPSDTCPPDVELILLETFEARLKDLNDPVLRHIALEKMNEIKNEDIAHSLKISIRSVERKLSLIRKKWTQPPPNRD